MVKILASRIARGANGEFAPVDFRVLPGQYTLDHTHQRQRAAIAAIAYGLVHRRNGAGGVKYGVKTAAHFGFERGTIALVQRRSAKTKTTRHLQLVGGGVK